MTTSGGPPFSAATRAGEPWDCCSRPRFCNTGDEECGQPLGILRDRQNNGAGGFTGTQRPNQIAPGALPADQRTILEWFNTNAFTPSAPVTRRTRYDFHCLVRYQQLGHLIDAQDELPELEDP